MPKAWRSSRWQQAKDIAEKTPAMAAAAKALTDKLLAIEGDMTQLQGQAGQDSLNFPGRFDNQITALYSSIANLERKAGTAVTERYADLKPQYDQMAERWNSAVATGVKDFNTAATKAGAATKADFTPKLSITLPRQPERNPARKE